LSQQWSPDGFYWWDGTAWRQASADHRQYFDGTAWQMVPGPPPATTYSSPPGRPANVPAAGISFAHQFGGAAACSMGLGLVAIVVPLMSNFYFPILPVFGVINAIRAIRNGRLAGGVIGIVLNLLGGLVSLLASGLIH
jgi:hypothetical protein